MDDTSPSIILRYRYGILVYKIQVLIKYIIKNQKACAAGLSIALRSIAVDLSVSLKTLSSVDYLHLKLEKELSKEAMALISRLSFALRCFFKRDRW